MSRQWKVNLFHQLRSAVCALSSIPCSNHEQFTHCTGLEVLDTSSPGTLHGTATGLRAPGVLLHRVRIELDLSECKSGTIRIRSVIRLNIFHTKQETFQIERGALQEGRNSLLFEENSLCRSLKICSLQGSEGEHSNWNSVNFMKFCFL